MALCPLSCSLLVGQQAVRAAGAVRLPGPVMFFGGMLVGVAVVASLWRGSQGPVSELGAAAPMAAPEPAALPRRRRPGGFIWSGCSSPSSVPAALASPLAPSRSA